jgi:hypothetical protein
MVLPTAMPEPRETSVGGSDGCKPHRRRRSIMAQGGGRGTPVWSADTGSLAVKIEL